MPRDINGVYTLPAPMPVQPRTIPVTNIFNTVLADVKDALNNIPGDALAESYTLRADLTGQLQLASYRRSVIALCRVDGGSSANSASSGEFHIRRFNGLYQPGLLTYAASKRYNTEQMWFTGEFLGCITGVTYTPCTFTYGGVKYGGLDFFIGDAVAGHITWSGSGNFTPFGLDYYDTQTGTPINAEVNSSISTGGAAPAGPLDIKADYLGVSNVHVSNIRFPATQNPSSNANTLDDYDEGTWTPTLEFVTPGNASVTYSNRFAKYTKIGDVVHVQAWITTTTFTHTTASGFLNLTGLPFPVGTADGQFSGLGCYGRGFTWDPTYFHSFATLAVGSLVAMYLIGGGMGGSTVATRISETRHASGVNVEIIIGGTYKV